MKINTRSITLAATLAALCFATGLLPYVFFLPVMVAATTLSVGIVAFVGLAFGAVSILYSFTVPMSPVAIAFVQAPYIAIIPRVIAALGCFFVYKLLLRLAKPQKRFARAACVAGAAAVGSLLNTALVVCMFVLIMPDLPLDGGITLLLAVPTMLISGAIECVCMAIITPPITLTLDRVVLKKRVAAVRPAQAVASESVSAANDAVVTEPDSAGADGADAPQKTTDGGTVI